MSKIPFKGTLYKCAHCKDVIKSLSSGHFVTCKCGAISVDQTEWYTRLIGDISSIIKVDDEDK